MNFKEFNSKIQAQFVEMCKTGKLFEVKPKNDVDLVQLYLDSFSPGDDPVYRDPESTTHNCRNDKNFIKKYGNVVAIIDNKIVTLWDIEIDKNSPYYNPAKELSKYLKAGIVSNMFVETFDSLNSCNYEKTRRDAEFHQLGMKQTFKQYTKEEVDKFGVVVEGRVYEYNHFHVMLPKSFVNFTGKSIESIQADYRSSKEVFKRGLDEIPLDTLCLVRDLIMQGSLLNGDAHLSKIQTMIEFKTKYDTIPVNERDNWCWVNSYGLNIAKFRNELIGTLCVELAEGVELNTACKTWNQRVDPVNYMKAKAPITEAQKRQAIETIKNLGYEDSFNRRLASLRDINVNEIIHTNAGDGKIKTASVFDKVVTSTSTRHKRSQFNDVEEVNIDKFMKDILPNSTSVEVLLENRLENNLVVMHTSENEDCKLPFKWSNPFGWTYKGNLSGKSEIKENVAKAGGRIEAVLRCSLQWNDEQTPGIVDFDLHCNESRGSEIYFCNKRSSKTGGWLDVDMISPSTTGIENITWQKTPPDMEYRFYVHNFNGGTNTGFKVEIEMAGEIYQYHYTGQLGRKETTNVAVVSIKNGVMSIRHCLPHTEQNRTLWGLETNDFHKVNLMCLSPNYWGENNVGNKHYFFMLDKCKVDSPVKGFHAEFLNQELSTQPTRKFVDIFGNFYQIENIQKEHLAGIGFNSTVKDELIVRVKGSHQRVIKIKF